MDDFSSKLDLPKSVETIEGIDANHMQMARCGDKSDPQYRAIYGVLKQTLSRLPEASSEARNILPLRTASEIPEDVGVAANTRERVGSS